MAINKESMKPRIKKNKVKVEDTFSQEDVKEIMSINISKKLKKQLKIISFENERTISSIVEEATEEYIKRNY